MFVTTVLSSLALAAQQVPAPGTGETVVATGETPDDKKRVCKAAEEEIGSIIPKKVRRTKGEWAAIKRQNERRTRDFNSDKKSMASRTKRPGSIQ
jgi:hypothetical protein